MAGLAIKQYNTSVLEVPQTPETITARQCGCNFGCFYNEIVFASSSTDAWKADKTDFLFSKVVAADTITIVLSRNGTDVATITDDTYGNYYGFTTATLYVGWIADWTLIYNAFGGGNYKVTATFTILGNTYTIESRNFLLYPYSDELAHNTVRIETYQTGNIIRSEFDYSTILDDLPDGWYSSIRIKGTFGNKTPELEIDQYLDNSYNVRQIRPQIKYTYELISELIPTTIATALSSDNILANDIYLTSYNLNDDEKLRRVNVVAESFAETTHYQNGKLKYIINFFDKTQDIIKRNF